MVDVNGSRTDAAGLEAQEQRAKRMEIAYFALQQAISMARTLEREHSHSNGSETDFDMVAPALFRRIEELHHVLLDTLDAQERPLDDLRRVVEGRAVAA